MLIFLIEIGGEGRKGGEVGFWELGVGDCEVKRLGVVGWRDG